VHEASLMSLSRLRHIAVEGPIGVGKTTLARRLCAHLAGRLLLEAPEQNPYLERFYGDPAGFALRAQMAFLLHRADQVKVLSQTDAFAGPWVSDFFFAKDALFAGLTLGDDEYRLYRQVHDPIAERVPQPDLVVWLQAPVAVLQERIARRGIAMEQGIEADYLARLSDAYARYFASFTAAPVVAVDNETIDAATQGKDFDELLARLQAALYASPA
jgi:deoxyguanosine kinase